MNAPPARSSDRPGQGSPVLSLTGITRSFAGVQALADVSLELYAGEVTGLLGANGAGKSTLVRILSGVIAPDAGHITLNGQEVSFSSPRDALGSGIATVYQESSLAPNLDVASNLVLGYEPRALGGMFVSGRSVHARAREILAEQGIEVPLRRLAGDLTVAERQLTEIARALSLAASVVILDEPSSALAAHEAAELFAAIRRIRDRGVAVIFITHRLEEVPALCDRVAVLRDGRLVGVLVGDQITKSKMISLMVGREVADLFPERHGTEPDAVLEVDGVSTAPGQQVSVTLKRGETLGLTGLVGAGHREFARAIYGIEPRAGGTVSVDGRRIPSERPDTAAAGGIGYVSGDRREGVIGELDLLRNLSLGSLKALSRLGFVRRRVERRLAAGLVVRFGIRAFGLDQRMATLSGGNQQKALLARSAARRPKVLILDEPTLGVDIGARQEIYRLVRELTDQGAGILLVSSDLDEVLGLADRIIVFAGGRLVAERPAAGVTKEDVLALSVDDLPRSPLEPSLQRA